MGLPGMPIDRSQGRGSCQIPGKVLDEEPAAYLEEPFAAPSACDNFYLRVCGFVLHESDCRIDDFHLHQESITGRVVVSMVRFFLERTQQTCLFAITLLFAILAVIVMLLRILGRLKLGRPLDLSDYIMLSSCVCFPNLFSPTGGKVLK